MSSSRTALLLIRKPPCGSVDSWEAMKLALAFYGAQASVRVVFEGDGVANWVANMTPGSAKAASVLRFVKDLEAFGVPVFLVSEDFAARGFVPADLASPHAKLIERSALAAMIASSDSVAAI